MGLGTKLVVWNWIDWGVWWKEETCVTVALQLEFSECYSTLAKNRGYNYVAMNY